MSKKPTLDRVVERTFPKVESIDDLMPQLSGEYIAELVKEDERLRNEQRARPGTEPGTA
jgi:hypothetical protein